MSEEKQHCRGQGLEDMPEEVLAHVFALLSPQQLSEVELVSRRCRTVVVQHELWRQHSLHTQPAVATAVGQIDASRVPYHRPALGQTVEAHLPCEEAIRRSAFFKHLQSRLAAPVARESLVARALAASSTDHPQEGISNVLQPTARSRDLICYWSSRGSEDPDSTEALTFQLAHPLCLVTEVALRPFRAWFQWGSPIYAPEAVRFRLGGLHCFAPSGAPLPPPMLAAAARLDLLSADARRAGGAGSPGGPPLLGDLAVASGLGGPRPSPQQQWLWESPAYEVAARDELQRFPIPPTLCVGGYLRVELLGKRQRQAADDAYYACVGYLRVTGSPLYSFHLQQRQQQGSSGSGGGDGDGWQLAYCAPDPLLQAGGLVAVSEGGRLAAAAARGQEGDGSDEEDMWEDSDAESLDDMSTDEEEEEEGGDLDALGAVPLGPMAEAQALLQVLQALPPPGFQQAQQDADAAGGSGSGESSSSSSDEEGSNSSGGEGGEGGINSDNEWFPGGDAGAY